MSHRFTRAQLYQFVWSKPLRQIAPELGVSDVAIAKRCRATEIPLPGLGYWAKKEAGKSVPQAPLPPRALGQSDEIVIGPSDPYGRGSSDTELINMVLPPPPTFEDDLSSVQARAGAITAKVGPSSLARLHPATAKLLEEDEVRRKKHAESKWSWDVPIFDASQEKRRLRLINSLCNALASCGYKCSVGRKGGYELGTVIGDQRLGLTLAPKGYNRDKHYLGEAVPNDGKLVLQLGWYQPPAEITTRWADEDGPPLEKRLREIVTGLVVAAEWAYRANLRRGHDYFVAQKARAIEDQRRREEEAAKQERARISLAARKRREALVEDVIAWRRAADIRQFVQARLDQPEVTDDLRNWADWALIEADSMDPLARGRTPTEG